VTKIIPYMTVKPMNLACASKLLKLKIWVSHSQRITNENKK